jgi:MFS family permease
VQDKSADLILLLETISSFIGMVSCLLLGTYSDVLGRRLVMLAPVTGTLLKDGLITAVIYWQWGIMPLYVAYTLLGLSGGTAGE